MLLPVESSSSVGEVFKNDAIFKIKAKEKYSSMDALHLSFRKGQAFYALNHNSHLNCFFVSTEYATPFSRTAVNGLVPDHLFEVVDLDSKLPKKSKDQTAPSFNSVSHSIQSKSISQSVTSKNSVSSIQKRDKISNFISKGKEFLESAKMFGKKKRDENKFDRESNSSSSLSLTRKKSQDRSSMFTLSNSEINVDDYIQYKPQNSKPKPIITQKLLFITKLWKSSEKTPQSISAKTPMAPTAVPSGLSFSLRTSSSMRSNNSSMNLSYPEFDHSTFVASADAPPLPFKVNTDGKATGYSSSRANSPVLCDVPFRVRSRPNSPFNDSNRVQLSMNSSPHLDPYKLMNQNATRSSSPFTRASSPFNLDSRTLNNQSPFAMKPVPSRSYSPFHSEVQAQSPLFNLDNGPISRGSSPFSIESSKLPMRRKPSKGQVMDYEFLVQSSNTLEWQQKLVEDKKIENTNEDFDFLRMLTDHRCD